MHSHFPMLSPSLALVLFAFAMTFGSVSGQCQNFTTTQFTGGNGCSGNFFDIQANQDVTICSFDIHVGGAAQVIEVFAVTGGGSYVPNSGNPAAWSLLATTTVSGTLMTPTPLNLNLSYTVPASTIQGFLIRDVTSTSIDYTNGTIVGAPFVTNADMTIFVGQYTCTIGATFPVLTSAPRIWNGTIHYSTSNRLMVSQSGPGVGDLTVSLTAIPSNASTGWTFVTGNTALQVGSGPAFGILPDATTFAIFGYAYYPGNPFRFNTADAGY
jgi:hypothetical protein